jgi:hypothetical protein
MPSSTACASTSSYHRFAQEDDRHEARVAAVEHPQSQAGRDLAGAAHAHGPAAQEEPGVGVVDQAPLRRHQRLRSPLRAGDLSVALGRICPRCASGREGSRTGASDTADSPSAGCPVKGVSGGRAARPRADTPAIPRIRRAAGGLRPSTRTSAGPRPLGARMPPSARRGATRDEHRPVAPAAHLLPGVLGRPRRREPGRRRCRRTARGRTSCGSCGMPPTACGRRPQRVPAVPRSCSTSSTRIGRSTSSSRSAATAPCASSPRR